MAVGDKADLFFRKLRTAGLTKPAVQALVDRFTTVESAASGPALYAYTATGFACPLADERAVPVTAVAGAPLHTPTVDDWNNDGIFGWGSPIPCPTPTGRCLSGFLAVHGLDFPRQPRSRSGYDTERCGSPQCRTDRCGHGAN